PDLLAQPGLAERLRIVARALRASGGHCVTTSSRGIPQRILTEMGDDCRRFTVPPLDHSEIAEVLAAGGAPETMRNVTYGDVILAATRGHPLLVCAVINFLRRRSWVGGADEVLGIFTGDAAREVKSET